VSSNAGYRGVENLTPHGRWNVNDIYFGYPYRYYETYPFVAEYLDQTGGTERKINGGGDFGSVIDSMNDGDALVLGPGNWSSRAKADNPRGIFRSKEILIIGQNLDPAQTIWDYDPDPVGVDTRDSPLGGYEGSTSWAMAAFVNIRRYASIGQLDTNYAQAMIMSVPGGEKVSFVNCVIRLGGRNVSWVYDNSNLLGQARFTRCTFAEYTTWLANYSGSSAKILVNSAAYSGTRNGGATFSGTDSQNVAISLPDGSYNTTTYPSSGHLYRPSGFLSPVFF
jgi:hypothetical protein